MAKRGKGARSKGANFERLVAKKLVEATGLPAQRGLAQVRGGGAEVSDVEVDHFHIEAKNHIRCNIKQALKQASEDAKKSGKGKVPVAVTKDLREPILVTMYWNDWINLVNGYLASMWWENSQTPAKPKPPPNIVIRDNHDPSKEK